MKIDHHRLVTEEMSIQASIVHIFINQHFLLIFHTATKKFDEIEMLKLRDQLDLIHELL